MNNRIFDRFRRPVVSLAVLGYEQRDWRLRESQAIEKMIQDNPADCEAWLRRQSRLEQITVSADREDGEEDD